MPDRLLHRHVAMISDLHVGDPKTPRLEDFDRDEQFYRLLTKDLPERAGGPVSLVIAGDFIDFPQIFPELGKLSPGDRFGTTEEESERRMLRAIEGHPRVFAAVRAFVESGHQILLLPGNHDVDFHFNKVFQALRSAVGNPPEERLSFVREALIHERGIHMEHGNQVSYDNYFESWAAPILDAPKGEKRIERPWGTLFMDVVYNDLEEAYPFINKVYPHGKMAAIIVRMLRDNPKATLGALARLLKFFLLKGRKMVEGHILGGDDPGTSDPVTRAQVESLVADLGPMDPSRRDQLVEETWALVKPAPGGAAGGPSGLLGGGDSGGAAVPVDGLLGRTDERGLDDLANSLIRKGRTRVIAFGHTHDPVDSFKDVGGQRFFIFNTGGWIPRIIVADGKTPTLQELSVAPKTHDLRYLWADLQGSADGPTASLESLV